MHKIKFSHVYDKLLIHPYNTHAKQIRLLDVLPIRLENLSRAFLRYDTDNGKYELPKTGEYMLLLFEKGNSIMPTIRRYKPEKWNYYRGAIGEMFEVIITNKKDV